MPPAAAVLSLFGAALLGVLCADATWPGVPWQIYGALTAGGAVATALGLRHRRGTVLAALGTTWAVFALSSARLTAPLGPSPEALQETPSLWRVQVISTPTSGGAPPSQGRARAIVALCAQQRHGSWLPLWGQVALTLWAGAAVARGDVLQVHLIVRPLRDVATPWQEPLERLKRRRSISNVATVCGLHVHERRAHSLWASSDHARQRAAARLQRLLPARVAGLAGALALGDTSAIAPAQQEAWADAGIAHLLAVSGLHVGLVGRIVVASTWYLLARSRFLAERVSLRRLAHGAGLPAVWAYALFTGSAVSAQRAACMLTLVLLGQALGRGAQSCAYALGLAGLAILLVDGRAARSPGFWLSFVSVACLLGSALLTGPGGVPAAEGQPWGRRALSRLTTALKVGGIAAVGTAPVCGLFFGRFSLIAPLCNLVAVPVGGALATPLALATAGMSALLPEDHPVVLALAWACGAVLWALDELALRASALPGAALQADPWALRLSALGCLALALRWAWALGASWGWAMPRFGRKTVLWIWAVAALGAVAPWHALGTPGQNLGMLTLWHLDVGQGDSTLIGLPDGTWVLVDGGGQSYAGQPDPGRWAVAPALRALGVRRLRAVVLTHPHPDHMGGLKYVLGRWPTDALWRADEVHGVQEVQVLETLVRRGGGVVQGPPPYAQWGGVHVRALLPLQHRQASVNDHSIVLQLTYKSRRALLMGDAERAAEANVLPYVSRADILKAGHHGSRTSSSEALLRAVRPQAALISCGAQNRFGHPHPQTLAALKRHHSAVLRTDELGTVRLQTDGCTPWRYGAHATGWRPLPLPEAGP